MHQIDTLTGAPNAYSWLTRCAFAPVYKSFTWACGLSANCSQKTSIAAPTRQPYIYRYNRHRGKGRKLERIVCAGTSERRPGRKLSNSQGLFEWQSAARLQVARCGTTSQSCSDKCQCWRTITPSSDSGIGYGPLVSEEVNASTESRRNQA